MPNGYQSIISSSSTNKITKNKAGLLKDEWSAKISADKISNSDLDIINVRFPFSHAIKAYNYTLQQ